MTTVVENKADPAVPAVHAFVIGIGEYPFLEGGATPSAKTWGLKQLTSPPISALRIAEWLASEFVLPEGDGPARVLGSIELLVSQPGGAATFAMPGAAPIVVDRATTANVTDACDRWYQRAELHEDNIALFFFSGHGVAKGGWQGLLLEDFDGARIDPFSRVVNFDEFAQGMEGCRASKQCYFLDACRNMPDELFAKQARGLSLVATSFDTPFDVPRDLAVFRSTAPHQTAFGVAGQPTRFTTALLRALRGAGCTPNGDRWIVKTDQLQPQLNQLLRHEERLRALPLQEVRTSGDSLGFTLHVPKTPVVPVVIGCRPEADNQHAKLSIVRNAEAVADRAPDVRAWETELAANTEYEFSATFANGGPPRTKKQSPLPPLAIVSLEGP